MRHTSPHVHGNLSNMRNVFERLREVAGLQVVVGVPEGLKKVDDKGRELSLGEIAAVNCFGSSDGHIPSRPFLRQGVRKAEGKITRIYGTCLRGIVKGTIGVHYTLELIGTEAANVVKQEILDGGFVPNAPSTIDAKGSSRPLTDSGQLRQSVTHIVEPAGTVHR